ncbi:hypothetical protein Tco_1302658 [Tanacetum coccineum]
MKNKLVNYFPPPSSFHRFLSYTGRLQLITTVLESIHVYWASVFLLPTSVIKDINRLLKAFLWNQSDTTNGRAKVAWSTIYKPKDQGGLGLRNLQIWNQALLAKHIWNIAVKKDSLWKSKIFTDSKKSSEENFKIIVEVIKSKLLGMKVKDSKAIRDMEDKWKISCKRVNQKGLTSNTICHTMVKFLVSWSSSGVTIPIKAS